MAKVLIIDTDNGLSTLGSDERIEQVFGYRPRRFISSGSVLEMFDKLFEHVVIEHEDPLGKCEEEVYRLRDEHDLDVLVLDSVTAYQAARKREVKGDSDLVTLQMHGVIGEAVEELITKFTRTNVAVIVIGHTKGDNENDLTRYKPALTGRMAVEINRHFDIVAHALAETDAAGGIRYLWQINADESRACKSRLQSVSDYLARTNGKMPQNFKALFDLVVAGGYTSPKILILGDSGNGKTYSLKSLKKVESFPKKDCSGAKPFVPPAKKLKFGDGNNGKTSRRVLKARRAQ